MDQAEAMRLLRMNYGKDIWERVTASVVPMFGMLEHDDPRRALLTAAWICPDVPMDYWAPRDTGGRWERLSDGPRRGDHPPGVRAYRIRPSWRPGPVVVDGTKPFVVTNHATGVETTICPVLREGRLRVAFNHPGDYGRTVALMDAPFYGPVSGFRYVGPYALEGEDGKMVAPAPEIPLHLAEFVAFERIGADDDE